ncbi:hypothetical protein [Deefgea piscis]|uniref:hypothetical protein n=1 Tax=Deefgea piscis TaxID=2739061 RepID=UPI001C81BFF7|nr:hypothetical protein [Deefgea piscis]QZA80883.1 hypothetical protein K4H25_15535 [Deefgea piscis]
MTEYVAQVAEAVAAEFSKIARASYDPAIKLIVDFHNEIVQDHLEEDDTASFGSEWAVDYLSRTNAVLEGPGLVLPLKRINLAAIIASVPKPAPSTEWVEQIMAQASVYASAWSLVGGRFDDGDGLAHAEQMKAELRQMLLGENNA